MLNDPICVLLHNLFLVSNEMSQKAAFSLPLPAKNTRYLTLHCFALWLSKLPL